MEINHVRTTYLCAGVPKSQDHKESALISIYLVRLTITGTVAVQLTEFIIQVSG